MTISEWKNLRRLGTMTTEQFRQYLYQRGHNNPRVVEEIVSLYDEYKRQGKYLPTGDDTLGR